MSTHKSFNRVDLISGIPYFFGGFTRLLLFNENTQMKTLTIWTFYATNLTQSKILIYIKRRASQPKILPWIFIYTQCQIPNNHLYIENCVWIKMLWYIYCSQIKPYICLRKLKSKLSLSFGSMHGYYDLLIIWYMWIYFNSKQS
jgi:hypothetical protein